MGIFMNQFLLITARKMLQLYHPAHITSRTDTGICTCYYLKIDNYDSSAMFYYVRWTTPHAAFLALAA